MSRQPNTSQSSVFLNRVVFFVIGLVVIAAMFISASTSASRNVSAAGETMQPITVCTPEILWNQISNLGTNGTNSQDFETANNAFDSESREDFTVTPGQTWAIQKVVARGIYFNGSGPADSFNVKIGSAVFNDLSYTRNGDDFEISLPAGVTLQTGTYWAAVQAKMDFTPGGQWAWANRTQIPFSLVAQWRNPGGGYNIPQCVNFANRGAVCGIDPSFPEQAFRLEGLILGGSCTTPTATATPTPTISGSPSSTPTITATATPSPSPCVTPGSHDPSFNGSGTVTVPFGIRNDIIYSVAVQADGRIVAAGVDYDSPIEPNSTFAIVRYTVDGNLDMSFNGTGKIVTTFGGISASAKSVLIQPDGKIVAAGYSHDGVNNYSALVRYELDGTLDPSFGGTGKVTTLGGSANALALQADGKLVTAGGGGGGGQNSQFVLTRYNSDGTLDNSFDGDGTVITPMGNQGGTAESLAIQSDGKIVAGGTTNIGVPEPGSSDFAVVRYNQDGTLDTSFSGDGRAFTSFGDFRDQAKSIAIQSDGKIVAAGFGGGDRVESDLALLRYNPDGTLDTSFNGTGMVNTQVGKYDSNASSVAIQPDGKIIAAGYSAFGPSVYRFNSNGTFDTSFNGTGVAATAIDGGYASVAIQSDGRIVAAGATSNVMNMDHHFMVSRFIGGVPCGNQTAFDYDGDRKADISVFRPTDGAWYIQQSQAGLYGTLFGFGSDRIAPADYDGDGKTDIAVYRPSTGIWYVFNSSNGTVSYTVFGLAEDLPTPADYDEDGKADVSVFRPSTGTWYRQNSADGSYTGIQFGATEDKPTVGDFDGDGKSGIAVFRPSTGAWYRINSGDGSIYGELFGFGTDIITPADYDGDGKTDLAAYRASDGIWYLKYSSNASYDYKVFGLASDIPAQGDFDGDGKADICVFRPSDGTWYRQNSSNGAFIAFQFGANGDKPTMTAFRY